MSRCHPYPPPGYVKKAATELLGETLPAAQVGATSGEKHKHRDKDKKKKRKREDKEKDENNGHKDKRSHKTKKPAHGNDVGGVHSVANGKLEAVDNKISVVATSSSGGEKNTIRLPSHDRVSSQQQEAGKGGDRLSGSQISSFDEARISCTAGKSTLQPSDKENTGYQEPRSSKTRKAEPRAGFQEARSSSSTVKTASLKSDRPREGSHGVDGNLKPTEKTGAGSAAASTSRIVVPDKEINGRVPLVLVKPFDTGQSEQPEPQQEREERNLSKNQNHHRQQQQQQQQEQAAADQKNSDQKQKHKDDQKKKSSEKEKEKRHRFPEIKLPEIKEEKLEEDDAYLEWLYPSKRRPLERSREEKEEDVEEVWAEALFIPSVNTFALPYVVPF